VSHSIAPHIQFLISRVFAKLQPVLLYVVIDLERQTPSKGRTISSAPWLSAMHRAQPASVAREEVEENVSTWSSA
jgi:hypothetical protein